jgi:NDP-sugar pyrophosphorylase family protein
MIGQAVILCAGVGSRLRPFTDSAPKPMLPLLGVPLVEWNIRHFQQYGVREFFINLHHLPEVLRTYLGDGSRLGVKIHYHFEPELLGTAGGIKSFEDRLEDEFFVIYGDIFSHLDYGAMERVWRTKQDAIGMQTMTKTSNYADADVAELSGDGRVVAVHPKPHSASYQNAWRMRGAFILRRDILAGVAPGKYSEIGKDLIPAVVAEGGAFYGCETEGYSKGIDTLEKWKEVEAYLKVNGFTGEGAADQSHDPEPSNH